MTTITLRALRTLTASQSPTGVAIAPKRTFTLPNMAAAEEYIRRGHAELVPVAVKAVKSAE